MSQGIINIFTVSIGLAGFCLSLFNYFHMRRRNALETAPKVVVRSIEIKDDAIHMRLAFYKGEETTIYTGIRVKGFLVSQGIWTAGDSVIEGDIFVCRNDWHKKLNIFLEVSPIQFSSGRGPTHIFGDDRYAYFDFFIKKNKASMQDMELLRISLKSTNWWRSLVLMHQIETKI